MKKDKENPEEKFQKKVLEIFSKHPNEALNYRQVAGRLQMNNKEGQRNVKEAMRVLHEKRYIKPIQRRKYRLSLWHAKEALPQSYMTGIVDMKQTGKAYIIPDDKNLEDIFIASNNTNHALHGDHVKVFLFPQRKDHKPEGQIVEILERGKRQVVGMIQINGPYIFLIPDSPFMPVDVFIYEKDLHGARNGEKVIVNIKDWPARFNNPVGEVVQILGEVGDNDVEMQSILAEFEFPLAFPKEVEDEADKIPMEIPKSEIKKRRDFRKVTTITIDPADAKDFDDAISFQKLKNDNYEVGVHIADVSFYVDMHSKLEEEAYKRATSIYLVDRTIPMLPERLSNGVCSLRPNEEKLCFSAVFEMNEKAEVLNEWYGRTVICSDRRYAYEEAQSIIEGEDGDFKDEILTLNKLAKSMRDKRFKNGAINFHSTEVRFKLDEKARPIGVYVKESKEANHLIEEFMLLANKRVAEFINHLSKQDGDGHAALAMTDSSPVTRRSSPDGHATSSLAKTKRKALPFVYRIHDEPNPEKLAVFAEFVQKLGYQMNTKTRKGIAKSYNQLFLDIAGKGEENMIETIAVRTMSKAYYSTQNIGHYGLAFPFYTHFTSPIRRYPDVMVHRLLAQYLDGGKAANAEDLEERCKHSSNMEKKAADAERVSIKYKQAEYLKDKIGETFEGVISGVSKWGIYVELDETKCEGMVPLKTLEGDYYFLDEENYRVVGERTGRVYKLGDVVTIKVQSVDLIKKQMSFTLVKNLR